MTSWDSFLEATAREIVWQAKFPGQHRCAVCSFALAESVDKGCVIGNCSYRPPDGSAEDERVTRNKADLTLAQGIVLEQLRSRLLPLLEAGQACHDRLVSLVKSGDCGHWPVEDEEAVMQMRAAKEAALEDLK